jgi:putative flavoprotein involved in K+ transport
LRPERHQVVVVGAGAAGLGVAAELARRGLKPLVLERSSTVGASWRARYEGLVLNNDRWSARLPGSLVPRRAGRWPRRDEFVAYLDRYAAHHELSIRFGVTINRIQRDGTSWRLWTSAGPWLAHFVVICTGHDHLPHIPDWPGAESFDGDLLHASEFQHAGCFDGQDVLVVGLGTSATEIAVRLAQGGPRRVRVAVRSVPNLMPSEFLGVPITLFARLFEHAPARLVDLVARLVARIQIGDLTSLGLAQPPYGVATELAVKGMGPVIDRGFLEALRTKAIGLVASVVGFDGTDVKLSDGVRIQPDVVIAATGYEPGLEGLVGELGVLAPSGIPTALGAKEHPRAPGLFFNGYRLPLSGELSGMRRDSRKIAQAIARRDAGSTATTNSF